MQLFKSVGPLVPLSRDMSGASCSLTKVDAGPSLACL